MPEHVETRPLYSPLQPDIEQVIVIVFSLKNIQITSNALGKLAIIRVPAICTLWMHMCMYLFIGLNKQANLNE